MDNISIGILDLGYREGLDPLTAVQNVINYAVRADELHFSRFWLAEHHNPNRVAPFTNPDIIISLIAGMTSSIRVGSAGTLVRSHSSYDVVTNFKLMNNLFDDRIDLGLSKGSPGSLYLKQKVSKSSDNSFDTKVGEIHSLLHEEEKNFLENEVAIPPYGGRCPEVWYLSNSYKNFSDAIRYKFNFCRSILHGQKLYDINFNREELNHYKELYFDRYDVYPKVSLAMGIIIKNTMEEAEAKYAFLFGELLSNEPNSLDALPVTIESLYHLLYRYRDLYGIDEFILYDMESNNESKIVNLEKISNKFSLKPQEHEN